MSKTSACYTIKTYVTGSYCLRLLFNDNNGMLHPYADKYYFCKGISKTGS
jgi:hypothetical protein